MTLRRISLTLALLTAPSWADDLDDVDGTARLPARTTTRSDELARSGAAIEDVLFRSDGSVESVSAVSGGPARSVPWNLVRLVLPDVALAGESDAPTRVDVEPRPLTRAVERGDAPHPNDLVSLRSLTGLPVTDGHGDALGLVRGALLSLPAGQAPALVVELQPQDGSAPRAVAVPWSMLDVVDAARSGVAHVASEDARWLRAAPAIDAEERALEAGGAPRAAHFSPRLDGNETPDPLFDAWSDPR